MSDNSYGKILDEVKKLCGLHLEKIKLQVTENLTLLLSKVMLAMIAFVMIAIALIFLSIALSHWLKTFIDPSVTYCIIASIYLLVVFVVFAFRRRLIINPMARFLSRIILDAPKVQATANPTNTLQKSTNTTTPAK